MFQVAITASNLFELQRIIYFGVHPLRMTTTSSSRLKVGFAVAEEANA